MLDLLMLPLTLLTAVIGFLYFYLTANFNYWKSRGVPGPRPLPLLGTFPTTITGRRNLVFDLNDIYREFKGKAKFVGVFMARSPHVMVIDPELAKEVLINNFKCFMDNESSKWMDKEREPISSKNPFVLRGNDWKTKRSEIVPGLTTSRVKAMYPVIDRAAKDLVKFLKTNLQECHRGIETKNLILKYTGEIVAAVVWGIEANAFEKDDCTFVEMGKKLIRQTFNAVTYYLLIDLFPVVRRIFYVRFFPEVTDKFFTRLTEMSLELRGSSDERQDFLGHLIQLKEKKNLPVHEVVGHNLTFLFDAFETSAGLISHCLLLLARNPEVQDKLRNELLGSEGPLSFDDLMKLPYLDQVMNETLRIFTPLAFMSKICTEPYELTNSDGSKLQLQKEDIVLLSIFSYHHDEEYFPEPEKFVPERFSEEFGGTKKFKDLGVYMPFGDGPRICLGMKFGLTQAKAAVAEVIRNFKLTVDEDRTVKDNTLEPSGFILNLKGGIFIKYKELGE